MHDANIRPPHASRNHRWGKTFEPKIFKQDDGAISQRPCAQACQDPLAEVRSSWAQVCVLTLFHLCAVFFLYFSEKKKTMKIRTV